MMRGGWLLSIYRENFVDNIRRSLRVRLDGEVEKWEDGKLWEDRKVGG